MLRLVVTRCRRVSVELAACMPRNGSASIVVPINVLHHARKRRDDLTDLIGAKVHRVSAGAWVLS
jgi:hypothetical protein